jgi:hypothetical protein
MASSRQGISVEVVLLQTSVTGVDVDFIIA